MQQWLKERASMLRYTYIACLVDYVRGVRRSGIIFPALKQYLCCHRLKDGGEMEIVTQW